MKHTEIVKFASILKNVGLDAQAKQVEAALWALAKKEENFVFPPTHPKVKDDKGHFPLGSAAQARNALARASQYSESPEWWSGSLSALVKAVQSKVKRDFPSIETTKKSANPGKG